MATANAYGTLEERVQYYTEHPEAYTNLTYRNDPTGYLATAVYQDFNKSFGRPPTQDELDTYMPLVQTLGHSGAAAEIAKAHMAFENSPEKVAERKRAETDKKAVSLYSDVNELFKSNLGREATQDEQKHFAAEISNGADAYTIGQFLQALPENVKKQDAEFRKGLSAELQGQDAQYYNEQILPSLQKNATMQGRSLDSSGVNNSLALAAQQQNRQREDFLSNLSANQYGGSQALAQSAYQNAYGNYQNTQDYNLNANQDMWNANMNRMNSLSDYNIQKQAYDQYLTRYGKRSGGMAQGAIQGGISGASIGGTYGGGYGALAGGVAGAALGAYGGR